MKINTTTIRILCLSFLPCLLLGKKSLKSHRRPSKKGCYKIHAVNLVDFNTIAHDCWIVIQWPKYIYILANEFISVINFMMTWQNPQTDPSSWSVFEASATHLCRYMFVVVISMKILIKPIMPLRDNVVVPHKLYIMFHHYRDLLQRNNSWSELKTML